MPDLGKIANQFETARRAFRTMTKGVWESGLLDEAGRRGLLEAWGRQDDEAGKLVLFLNSVKIPGINGPDEADEADKPEPRPRQRWKRPK